MSSSVGGIEFYPGQDLSVLQLLQAARRNRRTIYSVEGMYLDGHREA